MLKKLAPYTRGYGLYILLGVLCSVGESVLPPVVCWSYGSTRGPQNTPFSVGTPILFPHRQNKSPPAKPGDFPVRCRYAVRPRNTAPMSSMTANTTRYHATFTPWE